MTMANDPHVSAIGVDDLAEAMRAGHLTLAYQPMIALESGMKPQGSWTKPRALSAVSTSGITVVYNPQISVTGSGAATIKEDIMAALRDNQGDLLRLIESAVARKQRTIF